MTKVLAVLSWPAGIALIIGVGALLARRARPGIVAKPGYPAGALPAAGRHGTAATDRDRDVRLMITNAARSGLFLIVGGAVIFAVMAALGTLVVHAGPAIDKPVFHWIVTHRISAWARVMDRLTKLGDTWTTWGACLAAAVCMMVSWRRNRWLPPAAFAAAIILDHYLTLAIRHTFHRIGPPGSPGGTFPSGGVDRVILLYGLIAYLLWREFSGQRRIAIWAGTAVAVLSFNEAYSRDYLTLHWTTDILSGLLYGSLLLLLAIGAVRLVVGPASAPAGTPASAGRSPALAAGPAWGGQRE